MMKCVKVEDPSILSSEENQGSTQAQTEPRAQYRLALSVTALSGAWDQ